MKLFESLPLRRDCEAIQIPSGESLTLPAGSRVRVTQALGGTFTVMTEKGYMARIAEKDGDALGADTAGAAETAPSGAGPAEPSDLEKMVWDQLRTIYDPEIPIDVVELGLVYLCQAIPVAEDAYKVKVQMTLTAPGCGMGDVLRRDALAKIRSLPGVKEAEVEIVFDPPWDRDMMSEAAKLQLGLF